MKGLRGRAESRECTFLAQILPGVAVWLARRPQARVRLPPSTKHGQAVVCRAFLNLVVCCSVRALLAPGPCESSAEIAA